MIFHLIVNNEEESHTIQTALLDAGCYWGHSNKKEKKLFNRNSYAPVVMVIDTKKKKLTTDCYRDISDLNYVLCKLEK